MSGRQLQFGFTAQETINENRITRQEIENFKLFCADENFPKLTDEQIVLFLLSCFKQPHDAKKTILAYHTTKNKAPQLFNDRSLKREDLIQQLKILRFCVFPQKTEDGCCVIYHRLFDTYYSNYNMEPAMKLLFMTLDAAIVDYPPEGLIILFDMQGVSKIAKLQSVFFNMHAIWVSQTVDSQKIADGRCPYNRMHVGLMHLTRVRLDLVRIFFNYLQEALPVRLKRIHVLNSVYFINKVISIIKPFLKAEVMQLVHFHPTDMDMEEFYSQWLPKRCLPEDYGGNLPSVDTLHEENVRKLAEMEIHFQTEEEQRELFKISK